MKRLNYLLNSIWLMTLLLATNHLHAQSDRPLSLVIESSTTSPQQVIPVDDIERITFNDGNMQLTLTPEANDAQIKTLIPLDDLLRCYFSDQLAPTAIEAPLNTQLRLAQSSNSLTIIGLNEGVAHTIEVVDIQGNRLWIDEHYTAGTAINTASWPKQSIYLIRINEQWLKVIN